MVTAKWNLLSVFRGDNNLRKPPIEGGVTAVNAFDSSDYQLQ